MGEGRAVVVGASMGGLLAARVLADRADHVTVVERDELPDGPQQRKGVPQGRHAHGLLPAGEQILRTLFPGLIEDLVAAGAQQVPTAMSAWWQGGGYRVNTAELPAATFFSRPFLEHGVRRRLQELPGVSFVTASARTLEAENGRVRGITVEDDEGTSTLRSDLVVDATGRGSAAPRWLQSLGFEAPPVAQVHVDLAYATRLYRRTPGFVPDGSWFVTISDPPAGKRIAVAFPIEGDRWIVTLAGCHGDHPPTDDDGHLAFARSLPTQDIARLVEHEEPLGPIVSHRLPSNQWRHYDALRRHPAGFLAIGDAVCSFTPVYGQGMTSAAQQAMALGRVVDRRGLHAPDLWRTFYKQAKKVIANPWAIAAGADFAFPETTGPKPPGTDVVNRYVGRVILASQRDPVVAAALWDVQGLLAPPPSLMRPAIALRVLRAGRRTGVDGAQQAVREPAPAAG
jgi:2-polyprenyl-6-methoxyphenol hydroxylase-like FAD-dependent oxidoreductase